MVENPLASHDDESREQTTAGSSRVKTAAGREMAERVRKRAAARTAGHRRVWCAFNVDDLAEPQFVLFGQQLPALEYAVEHHMGCKAVEFGVPLMDQLK